MRIRRKSVSLAILAIFIVFTLFPFSTFAATVTVDGTTYPLTSAGIQSAITDAGSGGTVLIGGNCDMTSKVLVSSSVTIASTPGNQCILLRNSAFTDSMFELSGGSTLTLTDIILDGNKSNVSSTGTLVVVNVGGTLNLGQNSILRNNHRTNSGGGVGNNGTVNMTGNATISGNSVSGNSYGGGGIGIFADARFTMSGTSSITGNSSDDFGGGIALGEDSYTTLSGDASITGNTCTNEGAGICLVYKNAHLTMTDNVRVTGNVSATNKGEFTTYALSYGSNPTNQIVEISGNVTIGDPAVAGSGLYASNIHIPPAFTITNQLTSTINIGYVQTPTEGYLIAEGGYIGAARHFAYQSASGFRPVDVADASLDFSVRLSQLGMSTTSVQNIAAPVDLIFNFSKDMTGYTLSSLQFESISTGSSSAVIEASSPNFSLLTYNQTGKTLTVPKSFLSAHNTGGRSLQPGRYNAIVGVTDASGNTYYLIAPFDIINATVAPVVIPLTADASQPALLYIALLAISMLVIAGIKKRKQGNK